MEVFIEEMNTLWQTHLQSYYPPHELTEKIFTDLVTRYGSNGRYYHDLRHIRRVLDAIEELSYLAHDLNTIRLAAWFHDIIYEVGQGDNEERSADYAVRVLQELQLPKKVIRRVQQLILCTKCHEIDQENLSDIDAQILIDADLATLAAPTVEYHRYAVGIRREYARIPEKVYSRSRRNVLQEFLLREQIFQTWPFSLTREILARANIAGELATFA